MKTPHDPVKGVYFTIDSFAYPCPECHKLHRVYDGTSWNGVVKAKCCKRKFILTPYQDETLRVWYNILRNGGSLRLPLMDKDLDEIERRLVLSGLRQYFEPEGF